MNYEEMKAGKSSKLNLDAKTNLGNSAAKEIFRPTSSVGKYMEIDTRNKLWCLQQGIIRNFSELLSFELIEDDATIMKGGVGRAAVGGALFGSVGAIVGSNTRSNSNVCTSLKIKIVLNNTSNPITYLAFISAETKKDGFMYRIALEDAQKCLSALQIIINTNEEEKAKAEAPKEVQPQQNVVVPLSPADEIRKFKGLLDDGIITQEEFDAKKKELLNL